MRTILLFICLLGLPAAAGEPPRIHLALKGGGHFPQIASRLGTSADAVLSLGYAINEAATLQIYGELGARQPSYRLESSDPRLESGSYSSTLRVLALQSSVGLSYLFRGAGPLVPYLGAGPQVHFVRSSVEGEAESAFGRSEETSTAVGALLFGGVGFKLGPGLLQGELRTSLAPIEQRVTGAAMLGGLTVLLGYGLMI